MHVYGLTGGIASGKSTVSRILADLGANIVDADQLSRAVVAPNSPGLREVIAQFGSSYLDAEGALDRKALGNLIFANSQARITLNRILHPLIAQAAQVTLQSLRNRGEPLAIYEAPLIVENNLHETMDGLIVVSCPVEIQRQRLQARDGISVDVANARIAAQLPLSKKIAVADYVIDNSENYASTKLQIELLWSKISNL